MEPSVVEKVLVDLIRSKNSGISDTLNEQEAELAKIDCTDRQLGEWLEDFEISIVEILNAPDDYFHSRFPELKDLDAESRAQLAQDILEHSQTCLHCRQKVALDQEFEKLVDDLFESNRDEIKGRLYSEGGEI